MIRLFAALAFLILTFGPAQAGHLFTQASSNTPTWIQEGKGIAITQYGDEGGAGSGSYSIDVVQPSGGVPAEATQGDPQWWQWSSGDVMRITLPLADATYTRTIAYDADAACAYDQCGVTGSISGTWTELGLSGVTLPAHSGEQASYTSSNVGFVWTIESLAGEFSLGGYRFYTAGGTIDGTGAGPLDQSSVVDSDDLPSTGGSRDITNSDDTQAGLGSATTYAFDGGTLTVTGDETADFVIKDGGGAVAVGDGETHELSGDLSDDSGAVGAFTKSGNGTLVLSGTNTHTGGTTVTGGTLQVASDDALGGAGSGITLDGGTLGITEDISTMRPFTMGAGHGTIDVEAGDVFETGAAITGTGDLTKSGGGRFQASGTSAITGSVNVQGGEFAVEGSMTALAVSIFGGARLSGSGTIGAGVTVQGTVAPGSSPGTMTVAGDFTLTPASTFEAEIDGRVYNPAGGAGTYDRLAVTGATSVFTADGTLNPVLRGISAPATNSFDPIVGDRFRIVTTENPAGVIGEFATINAAPLGLGPQLRFDVDYGGDFVDLVVVPFSYATLAASRNRNTFNAASALELIRPSATSGGTAGINLLFAGLRGYDDQTSASVLAQIAGQVHAFALADIADLAHGMVGSVKAFDTAAYAEGKHLWAVMGGSSLHFDADARADGYSSSQGHIWAGIDLISQRDLRLGFAIGHGTSDLSAGLQGSADIEATMLMGYAAKRIGRTEISAKLAFGDADLDTDRRVALVTGTQIQSASSSADIIAFELSASRRQALPHGFKGRAFATLSQEWVSLNGYAERGIATTAVTAGSQNLRSTRLKLGYEIRQALTRANGEWRAGLAVVRGFGDTAVRNIALQGAGWTVSSPDRRNTSIEMSLGLRIRSSKKSSVDMSLAHLAGDGRNRTSAQFQFAWRW